jgi:hypothetical protein
VKPLQDCAEVLSQKSLTKSETLNWSLPERGVHNRNSLPYLRTGDPIIGPAKLVSVESPMKLIQSGRYREIWWSMGTCSLIEPCQLNYRRSVMFSLRQFKM